MSRADPPSRAPQIIQLSRFEEGTSPVLVVLLALALLLIIILAGITAWRELLPDATHGLGSVRAALPGGRTVDCVVARDHQALALTCDWSNAR